MKQIVLILSIVFISCLANAQQDVQYTNFMFSKLNFNPGFAGINDGICLNGLARQQWMGYKGYEDEGGAPNTFYFAGQTPVKALMGGMGLTITNDKIGFENNTTVRLAYSFHLDLGNGTLGLGIQPGLFNKQMDYTKFRAVDEGDIVLQGGATESAMSFDLAFGAYYRTQKYYAGFSMTQMQGFWGGQAEYSTGLASPDYAAHTYITGGYFYELPSNPAFTINPHILVKTDFASAQYDINALLWYNNQMYAGVTYRSSDAVALLAGYRVETGDMKGLMGGISYDITTSALSSSSSGTFEIFLKYCFTIVRPVKRIKHGTVLYL